MAKSRSNENTKKNILEIIIVMANDKIFGHFKIGKFAVVFFWGGI